MNIGFRKAAQARIKKENEVSDFLDGFIRILEYAVKIDEPTKQRGLDRTQQERGVPQATVDESQSRTKRQNSMCFLQPQYGTCPPSKQQLKIKHFTEVS